MPPRSPRRTTRVGCLRVSAARSPPASGCSSMRWGAGWAPPPCSSVCGLGPRWREACGRLVARGRAGARPRGGRGSGQLISSGTRRRPRSDVIDVSARRPLFEHRGAGAAGASGAAASAGRQGRAEPRAGAPQAPRGHRQRDAAEAAPRSGGHWWRASRRRCCRLRYAAPAGGGARYPMTRARPPPMRRWRGPGVREDRAAVVRRRAGGAWRTKSAPHARGFSSSRGATENRSVQGDAVNAHGMFKSLTAMHVADMMVQECHLKSAI